MVLVKQFSFLEEPIELSAAMKIKNQENRSFICQSKLEDIAYPK